MTVTHIILIALASHTLTCISLACGKYDDLEQNLYTCLKRTAGQNTLTDASATTAWLEHMTHIKQSTTKPGIICATCSGNTVCHQWASLGMCTHSLPWWAWQRQESKCSLHLCTASACLLRLVWWWLSGCPVLAQVHLYTCSHHSHHWVSSHPAIVIPVYSCIHALFVLLSVSARFWSTCWLGIAC